MSIPSFAAEATSAAEGRSSTRPPRGRLGLSPMASRIIELLASWSKRRGGLSENAVDEFARVVADAGEPGTVEASLVRLAFQAAGPGTLRVELWRGRVQVAAWPEAIDLARLPRVGADDAEPLDLPLRCGGQDRGTLRILPDGPRPIDPERHRRLATLAVFAAAADSVRNDDPGRAGDTHEAGGATRPTHDPATGLPNAIFLDSFLTYALALAERRNEPLSLLYLGVDRLAAIQQLHGAGVASEALRKVGRTMSRTLRTSDLIARLDDGRLVAVLPGASTADALRIAEILRTTIATAGVATPTMPLLTASIGVATYPEGACDALTLRAAAAAALAEARSQGRNKIACAPSGVLSGLPSILRIAQHAG